MINNHLKKTTQSVPVIFIVEDNMVYAKSLKEYLTLNFTSPVNIQIFSLGELCLAEIDSNPNVIIMDYFLNSKYKNANNGIEIIKRIKVLRPETNIIILSSHEKNEIIDQTMKLYNCEYIKKDVSAFKKVVQLIKAILLNKTPKPFESLN